MYRLKTPQKLPRPLRLPRPLMFPRPQMLPRPKIGNQRWRVLLKIQMRDHHIGPKMWGPKRHLGGLTPHFGRFMKAQLARMEQGLEVLKASKA
ncbi:hypothetical protein XENTR_v10018553 [Xenopus tropicalis]|nr:hypothetical protein XENTR_v10018553 [Xenopus tropicalis]